MKDQYIALPGKLRSTYWTDEVVVENTTRYVDSVSGYSLIQGDHKKPTFFSYLATTSRSYNGRLTRFQSGLPKPYFFVQEGDRDIGVMNLIQIPDYENLLYNQALSRLYDQARGQIDLSIDIAERHDTKQMIESLNKLDTYTQNNGKYYRRTIGTKSIGANFLAFKLGMLPLISTIYESINLLIKDIDEGKVLRLRASATHNFDRKEFPISGTAPRDRYPKDFSGKQGVRIVTSFRQPSKFDIARWSSLNPVSIAWELMPLSFVWDYFYDIGGMLRSLETSLLWDSAFFDGQITYLKAFSISHEIEGSRNVSGPLDFDFYEGYSSYGSYKRFTRSPLNGAPMPRLPTWKLPTSSERLLTMAALLRQRLRGGGI